MDRDHSGLWGDVITVNGVPWPFHDVERRFYRFRILMATLSRSMRLSFVNTRTGAVLPTYVVATDGGVMPPQQVASWRHSSAERYEVMVDLGTCRVGDRVELRNASPAKNRDFLHTNKVMQLRVTQEPTDTRWTTVPTPPASEINPVITASAAASRRTRNIDLEHDDVTNEFLINGQTWRDVQAGQLQPLRRRRRDPAPAGRPRDLADRERLRRLVPPAPLPPGRLPDPETPGRDRPGRGVGEGGQGRRLRGPGRARRAAGPLRDAAGELPGRAQHGQGRRQRAPRSGAT